MTALVLLLVACGGPAPFPVGPIDCGQAAGSLAAALADVDTDGDGVLTAADLAPGEAAAVVSWTGADGPTGVVAQVAPAALSVCTGCDWDPIWSVPVPADCLFP
jgi:hypothetical protein